MLRLQRVSEREFDRQRSFTISAFVDPPGVAGEELDLEGMDLDGGALWVAGSHGVVRDRARDRDPADEIPTTLAKHGLVCQLSR